MNLKDIAHLRLVNQRIVGEKLKTPAEVVRWMGAMQAQDYYAALWGVGLRTKSATIADVERAIAEKQIVRTWPMRGTLHFVSPENIRWMLKLMTPRIIRSAASRHRSLGLDDEVFAKSREVLEKALQGGNMLTRGEIYTALEQAGISAAGQRGIHILGKWAQEGLLCFGSYRGKQPTFVLLDEWIPRQSEQADVDHEEALAKIARTFFISHGPATLQDFVWWTGLKISDARYGLEMVKNDLINEIVEGKEYWMNNRSKSLSTEETGVYLLPAFEEYMLGYRDRSAALEAVHAQKVVPGGNGIFFPIIVSDGQIVGTWKKLVKKDSVIITLSPFRKLKNSEKDALEIAAERYGRFIGLPASLLQVQ